MVAIPTPISAHTASPSSSTKSTLRKPARLRLANTLLPPVFGSRFNPNPALIMHIIKNTRLDPTKANARKRCKSLPCTETPGVSKIKTALKARATSFSLKNSDAVRRVLGNSLAQNLIPTVGKGGGKKFDAGMPGSTVVVPPVVAAYYAYSIEKLKDREESRVMVARTDTAQKLIRAEVKKKVDPSAPGPVDLLRTPAVDQSSREVGYSPSPERVLPRKLARIARSGIVSKKPRPPKRYELLLNLDPDDTILFYPNGPYSGTPIPIHKSLLTHYSTAISKLLSHYSTITPNIYTAFTKLPDRLLSPAGARWLTNHPARHPHLNLTFNNQTQTYNLSLTDHTSSDLLHLFTIYMYHGLPLDLLTPSNLPILHSLLPHPPPSLSPDPYTTHVHLLLRAHLFAIRLGADEFASDLIHLLDEPSPRCRRSHGLFVLPAPTRCECTTVISFSTYCTLVRLVYSSLYPTPATLEPDDNLDHDSDYHKKRFFFRYRQLRTGVKSVRLDVCKILAFSAARYLERVRDEAEFVKLRGEYWGRFFFRDVADVWYAGKMPVEETLRTIEKKAGVRDSFYEKAKGKVLNHKCKFVNGRCVLC